MQYLALSFLIMFLQQSSFRQAQLKHSRVKAAYDEKEDVVKAYFREAKIEYAGFQLFIRCFKREQKVEVWVKEKQKETFLLLHTYDFCALSGVLGPKRKEGDLQIPEGVYHVSHFNPLSTYHLSLGVSYPNASDKILSDPVHPGGAIYVHGNCVTIGCIPLTDDKIKELYILAVEARSNGQVKIPLYIFPAKLNDAGIAALKHEYANAPKLLQFWSNLKPVYDNFEKTKKLRPAKVDKKGAYYF